MTNLTHTKGKREKEQNIQYGYCYGNKHNISKVLHLYTSAWTGLMLILSLIFEIVFIAEKQHEIDLIFTDCLRMIENFKAEIKAEEAADKYVLSIL